MSDWNSCQYMKFSVERTQPSADLISRFSSESPNRILDIGCGPGNSTNTLAKAFPNAKIIGIDCSDDMLEKARRSYPHLCFVQGSIPDDLDRIDGNFDIIFSNACLQWIPEHRNLIPAIVNKLADGGTLAVQVPYIQKAPFYKLLHMLVNTVEWRKLSSVHNFHNLTAEEYYDLLSQIGSSYNIWETVYYHTVDSPEDVIEWYKGSGLRPYLDLLDDEERSAFIGDLLEIVSENFPKRENGAIILKMPRIFFTLKK